jgi:hypothetical protein
MPEHPQSYFLGTIPGAFVAGSNAVQTLSITGGPPTTLTFLLRKDGMPTAPITWSNNNTTLLASLQTALNAAYGTNSFVATAGTLTAGIGTILLTAGAKLALQVLSTCTVEKISETGTATTLSNATTTPGVTATFRDAPPGGLIRSENGNIYRNQSPAGTAVNWIAI